MKLFGNGSVLRYTFLDPVTVPQFVFTGDVLALLNVMDL